ncbi:MAG: hypothetical protein AABY07_08875 [Nanoarchaeota archaeon]
MYKIIMVLVIFSLFLTSGCLTTIENAEQYGYITNVEASNGIIFKEARVYFKSDLESSQEESICIDDEGNGLIEQARNYAKNDKRVILKYHEEFMTSPNRCHNVVENNIGILDSIEVIKER